MNRHFFADDDPTAKKKGRCFEVELLRDYMKANLPRSGIQMFLDIHAHSVESSIFVYSPEPKSMSDIVKTRNFATKLDEMSEIFSFEKCTFSNEEYKKNCARLGVFRDQNLVNSYTIESSCYGYDVKLSDHEKALIEAKRKYDEDVAPPEIK